MTGIFYLQNHVDQAMEMYQEMHMWDEAIEVAEAKVYLDLITRLYIQNKAIQLNLWCFLSETCYISTLYKI